MTGHVLSVLITSSKVKGESHVTAARRQQMKYLLGLEAF